MWRWARLPSNYIAATESVAENIRTAAPVTLILTIYTVEGGLSVMALACMLKDWIEKGQKGATS